MALFMPLPIRSANLSIKKSISLELTTKLYPIGVNTSLTNFFNSVSDKAPTKPNRFFLFSLFSSLLYFK